MHGGCFDGWMDGMNDNVFLLEVTEVDGWMDGWMDGWVLCRENK